MVTENPLDARLDSLLAQFLAEVAGPGGESFTDETDLVTDLMLDSLDFVSLIAELEAAFGIAVPDEDATVHRFGTVGAIRGYVHEAAGA